MSALKSLNTLLLEGFFGVEFESDAEFAAEKEMRFFDGGVFWDITFHEDERLLVFVAGTQEVPQMAAILEVGIHYDELKVDELPGMGWVLTVTPLRKEPTPPPFWLTKLSSGRFVLATSL